MECCSGRGGTSLQPGFSLINKILRHDVAVTTVTTVCHYPGHDLIKLHPEANFDRHYFAVEKRHKTDYWPSTS